MQNSTEHPLGFNVGFLVRHLRDRTDRDKGLLGMAFLIRLQIYFQSFFDLHVAYVVGDLMLRSSRIPARNQRQLLFAPLNSSYGGPDRWKVSISFTSCISCVIVRSALIFRSACSLRSCVVRRICRTKKFQLSKTRLLHGYNFSFLSSEHDSSSLLALSIR